MPILRYRVKANFYRDSVALMRLSSSLLACPGILQATAIMATPANRAALADSGWPLSMDDGFSPDDLLLAVEGESEAEVETALAWAEAELTRRPLLATAGSGEAHSARTLAEGERLSPAANLAMISVPGEYAYAEALKALKAGLHVFLFSSGVTIEDEARLKQFAAARGLLLMGAECGTALLGGVPLGFANAARRGNIGLVAASGSGLQEVVCLIHQWGGGISHAIGTGGRDLHELIGGTTTLAGLRLLLDDPETDAIVLLSKPPAPIVAARVLAVAAEAAKPIIVAFLGADPASIHAAGLTPAATLEEAARLALTAVGQTPLELPPLSTTKVNLPHRFLRGLFAGGTLCTEARLILQTTLGPILQPPASAPYLAAHTCLDLGEEEYTRGRPHPMMDARLRAEKLLEAACQPDTAIVLFDVILGYGASPDPVGPLLAAIAESGEGPAFVAHVCGTEADPQGMANQIARLREAGVVVAPTNAAAARLAGEMIQR